MESFRPHLTPGTARPRGFTLVEMLVVLAIISIVTTVTLLGNSDFDRTILLTDTAYTVAISARQMQTYGLSSRVSSTGVLNAGYGVYASAQTPGSYLLFADTTASGGLLANCLTGAAGTPEFKPGNCRYTAGSDVAVETMTLTRGMRITNLCGYEGTTRRCSSGGYLQALSAVYMRPNTDAVLSGQRTTAGTPWIALNSGEIHLSSADGSSTRIVCLSRIGQISVATSTCP